MPCPLILDRNYQEARDKLNVVVEFHDLNTYFKLVFPLKIKCYKCLSEYSELEEHVEEPKHPSRFHAIS